MSVRWAATALPAAQLDAAPSNTGTGNGVQDWHPTLPQAAGLALGQGGSETRCPLRVTLSDSQTGAAAVRSTSGIFPYVGELAQRRAEARFQMWLSASNSNTVLPGIWLGEQQDIRHGTPVGKI